MPPPPQPPGAPGEGRPPAKAPKRSAGDPTSILSFIAASLMRINRLVYRTFRARAQLFFARVPCFTLAGFLGKVRSESPMETRLITLTTDFGHKDPFVGIMKGVIFGIHPQARIVDLTHGVAPQDIRGAALALAHAAPYFPPATVHVAVVDPGVGTERRPVLIEAEGNFFVGPDNGVLALAVEGKKIERVIELKNESYQLKPRSATFHGRDVFAPAAAYLSLGVPAAGFGPALENHARLQWPEPTRPEGEAPGEISDIYNF